MGPRRRTLPPMDAGFVALFRHHAWASDRLFAACEGLPEEHLEFVTQGTYGGLGSTLRHLVEAEERLVSRLRGEGERPGPAPNQPDPPSPPEALAPSVRVLRRRVRASAAPWSSWRPPSSPMPSSTRPSGASRSRCRPSSSSPRRWTTGRAPDPGPACPHDPGLRAARHRRLGLGRGPEARRRVVRPAHRREYGRRLPTPGSPRPAGLVRLHSPRPRAPRPLRRSVRARRAVALAQSAEHWIVAPEVTGSSPVGHPNTPHE